MNLHTVLNGHGLLSLKNDIKKHHKIYNLCAMSKYCKERKKVVIIYSHSNFKP